MTAAIYTLGCRVNQYESEAIAEALSREGIIVCPPEQTCDAYIINTCTVTAESARKARQFIRRAIKASPGAFILVTGCYSQTSRDEVAAIEGVDYVCGSSNKMSVVPALLALREKGRKNAVPEICIPDGSTADFEKMSISSFGRTRAYLKIEDGCENKCAYCIIPRARGRVRSKDEDDVISEIKALSESGYSEVVLTGIETAAYGRDNGSSLISLLERADGIENLRRIRLSSLDPSYVGKSFADFAANSRLLCPHFHLSLQSGCDRTLAAMRRKYNTSQAEENMARLREAMPDVNFTADIIVGFPGESDEDFEKTCEFVKRNPLLHGHIFSYSRREGTEAADMPTQIPEKIKIERNRFLTEICERTGRQIRGKYIGRRAEVLFESSDGSFFSGHTANFIEVKVKTDERLHSQYRDVIIKTDTLPCEAELTD